LPANRVKRFYLRINDNICTLIGCILVVIGFIIGIIFVIIWARTNFSQLDFSYSIRFTYSSTLAIVIGAELFFAGFFVGTLRIKERKS
jgi:hypothetical protein